MSHGHIVRGILTINTKQSPLALGSTLSQRRGSDRHRFLGRSQDQDLFRFKNPGVRSAKSVTLPRLLPSHVTQLL